MKVQFSSSPTPTINLVDSNLEEELIASVPITIEVDHYLQSFIDLLNGDGKKYFIPLPTVLQSTSISSPITCIVSAVWGFDLHICIYHI